MKHRAGSSKIKYEHNMIPGLRRFLERIEPWKEIKSIIPAEIRVTKGGDKLSLKVQYPTRDGLKCFARRHGVVQEVFIVTSKPEQLKQRLEGENY